MASLCGFFLHSLFSFRHRLRANYPSFRAYLLVLVSTAVAAFFR